MQKISVKNCTQDDTNTQGLVVVTFYPCDHNGMWFRDIRAHTTRHSKTGTYYKATREGKKVAVKRDVLGVPEK